MSMPSGRPGPGWGPVSNLAQLSIFAAVVETGSFSGAARRVGLTAPSISRQVRNLEEQLGVRLVARTTRRILVTDVGERFYQRCRHALDEIEGAETEIAEHGGEPQGRIKMAVPTVVATRLLSPLIQQFLATYPKISVELVLTSERPDLVKEGIDLAISAGGELAARLIVVKLAPNRRVFVASPDYLAKHGEPSTPEELQHHECLVGRTPPQHNVWPVLIGGKLEEVRVNGRFSADNGELLLDAAVHGFGIAMLPAFVACHALKDGRVKSILTDCVADDSWVHAVVPHRDLMPAKTRALLDFLKASLARRIGSAAAGD